MISIVADNIDELYRRCLHQIMAAGKMTNPRGFNCKEISPCSVTLTNPHFNILQNPIRKASKAFMAAELLWILMGRDDVDMISFYNSKITQFSDDGVKFFGAYGPKVISQLKYVVDILQQDPWTRQAIINIWRECPPITKDVPCTLSMHFMRRPLDRLNLIVTMRSQDIWLGFPYDVHNFTSLQMILASMLGVKVGTFTLNQGSLHAYDANFNQIVNAMKWTGDYYKEWTPDSKINSISEFEIELNSRVYLTEASVRQTNFTTKHAPSCQLLQQKLSWLQEYGAKKHETR